MERRSISFERRLPSCFLLLLLVSITSEKDINTEYIEWQQSLHGGQIQSAVHSTTCARSDCLRDLACMTCSFPESCSLGETVNVECTTNKLCFHQDSFRKEALCLYCWQTLPSLHECRPVTNCSATAAVLHTTVCRVRPDVICKGSRIFYKNIRCNWCSGYSWARALLLSVTLGGFGADRFYLGLWKSGIGKLFSFGGLGVWTMVDVALIAIGYLRPSDGSMYA